MADRSFTGISFPFRISLKGGVVMSSTSIQDSSHIIEAIQQILLTKPNERCMEYHFKSDIDWDIFEANDISTHTLITYQINEALRLLEDRIEVIDIKIKGNDTSIYANISFRVLQYDSIEEVVIRKVLQHE